MRKILWSITAALVLAAPTSAYAHINVGEVEAPVNTDCRVLEYSEDDQRVRGDGSTHPVDRTSFSSNSNPVPGDGGSSQYEIFDLCIGSYPQYPSTGIEEGIAPFYYAKYYFLPDPLPYYEVDSPRTTLTDDDGGTWDVYGLDQTFSLQEDTEARDEPYDEDTYYFYPNDATHANEEPTPNSYINGPYQIGYNEYYHNAYRSRLFASQVHFSFEVREPVLTSTGQQSTSALFEGEILYQLPEECFREDALDYEEPCRSIEFLFPRGDVIDGDVSYVGHSSNTLLDMDESGTDFSPDAITSDRPVYNNPGQHELILQVEENTQLRYQKDIGTEFQTQGNMSNRQGNDPTDGYVHFLRDDYGPEGSSIEPRPMSSGGSSSSAVGGNGDYRYTVDSGDQSSGHFVHDHDKNANWLNYCDTDTDPWADDETRFREETGGRIVERDDQHDLVCYHHESTDYHFWEYYWSDTDWYAENPHSF